MELGDLKGLLLSRGDNRYINNFHQISISNPNGWHQYGAMLFWITQRVTQHLENYHDVIHDIDMFSLITTLICFRRKSSMCNPYFAMCTDASAACAGHDKQHVHIKDTSCATYRKSPTTITIIRLLSSLANI